MTKKTRRECRDTTTFSDYFCLLLLFALLAIALLTSCAPRPDNPRPTTLVATATAAEPRPTLPSSLRATLTDLAKSSKQQGQATVRLLTSPSGPPSWEKDITPLRSNGEVQHATADATTQITTALDDLAAKVHDATATTPGLSLLPLLDRASQDPAADIHVLSSGATTDDPTAFQHLGLAIRGDEVAKQVVQDSGLRLAGHHVTFHGLGVVAGSQSQFQPFERRVIEDFWLAVCAQAKADGCTVASDSPGSEPPLASLPVPVIPVATIQIADGCPRWQRLSDSDALHFAPNSPVLPPEADQVLTPIVASARRCTVRIDIAGFIADTSGGGGSNGGSGGDPSDLSGQRAEAVADRLLALGLPPGALGTVIGKGTAEPVVVNYTNGQWDEAKAQLNRRTELTFHHVDA